MKVPYSSTFDLGGLPNQGAELVLTPTTAERAQIARWLSIEGVESLRARISLSRAGADRYDYRANFEADVVQACVITLDPVRSHVSGEFHRSFELVPKLHPKRRAKPAIEPPIIAFSTGDEDERERLDNPIIDLAAPVLEELSLTLDPYPRAPGAAFDVPMEDTPPKESPFAVLEKLKQTSPQSSKRPAKPKSRKR